MTYPSTSDIQHWNQTVQPCCVRDDSLWGYAYAGVFGVLPSDPNTGLAQFQAFQKTVYTVASSIGWDADFVLGYAQQSGKLPDLSTTATTTDFQNYLNNIGARNPTTGAPTGAGYPKGGKGYPPAGSTGGTGGTGTGGTVSFDSVVKWVEANPIPAGLGAVALVLLLRR